MKQAGVEWCEGKANKPGAQCSLEAKWRAIALRGNRNYYLCDNHKNQYEESSNFQTEQVYKFSPIGDTVTPPSDQ